MRQRDAELRRFVDSLTTADTVVLGHDAALESLADARKLSSVVEVHAVGSPALTEAALTAAGGFDLAAVRCFGADWQTRRCFAFMA